ncbi:MAG: aquaporin [Chthoniobacterales bacterium]
MQFLGAFTAAAAVYTLFAWTIPAYKAKQRITRSAPGSEATAMFFGDYFPNPGGKALTADARATVPPRHAFVVEMVGTAILLLVIFCVTDERNATRPQILTAATIGLTVTLLISLLAPLTMAGFRAASFFRPRRLAQSAFHGQRLWLADSFRRGADRRRLAWRRDLSGFLPCRLPA